MELAARELSVADTHNSVVRMLQLQTPSIQINGEESSQFGRFRSHRFAGRAGDDRRRESVERQSQREPVPLPLSLADVTVTVNGVVAPILYVQPTLINFQVPWGTPSPERPRSSDGERGKRRGGDGARPGMAAPASLLAGRRDRGDRERQRVHQHPVEIRPRWAARFPCT